MTPGRARRSRRRQNARPKKLPLNRPGWRLRPRYFQIKTMLRMVNLRN